MSSIDTTGIDASKPTEGEATTQSVRDNFASIKTQLGTAKTELSDLSGVTDPPTARANIGAGTISTQDSASVSITGGSITGVTDIAIADGGTGASDAPTARTNLGLGTLSTQDDPATASTYIKRNAGNTAYDTKTPGEVLTDLQAARHDDLFSDWVVSGLLPATSASLTSDISAGAAYVTGRRIAKAATSHTYTASVDTYVDLDATGTYLYSEVATGAAAPAQPADSIRLSKVVTDASAITSVTDLRETMAKRTGAAEVNYGKDTTTAAEAVSGTVLSGAMLAAGALVEWGSNANGSYWRWESGLQVCAVDFVLGASVADGATVSATWTYPAAFASVPEVRVSAYSNSTNTARVIGGNDTNRTATSADVYGGNFRSTLGATAVAIDIRASGFAIGSWK